MGANKMGQELIEALEQLEKEKDISKEVLLEALENSLLAACKAQYNKSDNIKVIINRDNGKVVVYSMKTVVDAVEDDVIEISLNEARQYNNAYQLGDVANIEVTPKDFGRIAAQKAKQVILQKIREEERKSLFTQYQTKEKDIMTGIIQRNNGKNNLSVNLGKIDGILSENEQVKTEYYQTNDRMKVYVVEVKDTPKGPRVFVSRTHPELVKRLFEFEVTEIKDGTVEIKSVAREAGSRTKISVYSKNKDVDPVGACVGINSQRVNAIVQELRGEKIDIVVWDEDPAKFIENSLSPAKVISVELYEHEKTAKVIVPEQQLSLAIGKEGQNARLAAKLTGYKIDIKSDVQEKELEIQRALERLEQLDEDAFEIDETENLDDSMAMDIKTGLDTLDQDEIEIETSLEAGNETAATIDLEEDKPAKKKKQDSKDDFLDFVDFTALESSAPAKKKKAKKEKEEKATKKK